jgi:hypothetical protein
MSLPNSILAALDALEACYPSYSASALRARAEVERLIREALSPAPGRAPSDGLLLVPVGGGARGAR